MHKSSKREDLRRLQKAIKSERVMLKNIYYKELADTAAEARDVEKEFALAKKYSALKTSNKSTISKEKLKTYFAEHFADRPLPVPPELANPELFAHLDDPPVTVNEDNPDEEVMEVINTFKNNKSGGSDKLKMEGLKYSNSKKLICAIIALPTIIWTCIEVPRTWLHGKETWLHKKGKGSMNDAKNYRGLTIGANMSHTIAKVIINRLKEFY